MYLSMGQAHSDPMLSSFHSCIHWCDRKSCSNSSPRRAALVEAMLGSGVQPLGSKAQTDVLLRPVFISTNSISSLKGPKESAHKHACS